MAAVVFLSVAGLVSHLLNRSQTEATKAKVREHEAETIAAMVQVVENAEAPNGRNIRQVDSDGEAAPYCPRHPCTQEP